MGALVREFREEKPAAEAKGKEQRVLASLPFALCILRLVSGVSTKRLSLLSQVLGPFACLVVA